MRFLTAMLLAMTCAAGAQGQPSPDIPEALWQAERARAAIRTARIDWSIRRPMLPGELGERTHFRTWRCAGDRYLQELWGDDEGVYRRGDDDEPREARFQGPEATLSMDGTMWQHEARAVQGRVWNGEHRALFELFDFRRVGLHPGSEYDSLDVTLRRAGLPAVQYDSAIEEDMFHVVGRTQSANVHWWIDSARDWHILRTRIEFPDGTTIGEQEYELRRFDGRWFPARIVDYAGGKASGRISQDIQILAAEFNRPEHPQVLTPESIGIEPGTPLQYMFLEPPNHAPVWDGSGVVSMNEFYDRVRAGEAALGPTLLRERARVVARSERLARVEAAAAVTSTAATWRDIEAAWERYTRQFVERYRLEDKQAEQAGRICAACQQQAREFIDRNRDKLEALDRDREADAPDAAPPADRADTDAPLSDDAPVADAAPPSDEKTERAESRSRRPDRRTQLLARIDEIFDQRLKARLLTLPTDAQRDAAAKLRPIPEPRLVSDAARSRSGASRSDAAER